MITSEDRQRGWTEIDVYLRNGTRERLRISSPGELGLARLAGCSRQDQGNEFLKSVVPREKRTDDFIASISQAGWLQIALAVSELVYGSAAAEEIGSVAARTALSDFPEKL